MERDQIGLLFKVHRVKKKYLSDLLFICRTTVYAGFSVDGNHDLFDAFVIGATRQAYGLGVSCVCFN